MPLLALPILIGLSCACGEASTSVDASASSAHFETRLWLDVPVDTAEAPGLRLLLMGDDGAAAPRPSHGAWATLATGAPVALMPGLLLKFGAVAGGPRFFGAPPLSSAAQRMSVFRRAPRGLVALLF